MLPESWGNGGCSTHRSSSPCSNEMDENLSWQAASDAATTDRTGCGKGQGGAGEAGVDILWTYARLLGVAANTPDAAIVLVVRELAPPAELRGARARGQRRPQCTVPPAFSPRATPAATSTSSHWHLAPHRSSSGRPALPHPPRATAAPALTAHATPQHWRHHPAQSARSSPSLSLYEPVQTSFLGGRARVETLAAGGAGFRCRPQPQPAPYHYAPTCT